MSKFLRNPESRREESCREKRVASSVRKLNANETRSVSIPSSDDERQSMRESRMKDKGKSRGEKEGRREWNALVRSVPKCSLPYSARADSVPNPLL